MKYLIKKAKITQKGNSLNGKRMDILIEGGKITKIQKDISSPKAHVVESKNLWISDGWVDVGTHLGEPGHEHRETFSTLADAAKAGGFTDLVVMPNTVPPVQTKSQVTQIKNMGQTFGISIHPIGALSTDLKGENISEYVDLHHAGAIAFSDGLHPVEKGGLLMRALQYSKAFDGMIIHQPNDHSLAEQDMIHEGDVSTALGMKGSPALAEEMTVHRDIELTHYAEAKLTLHQLSTKGSTNLVKSAKKKGIQLYAGVSYLNLIKTDEDLKEFDTNLKVLPLIRSKTDQRALIKAIKDNTIDYIASNHVPLEVEKKLLEYPYADHGAIGLETCFAGLITFVGKDLDILTIINKLTEGPRSTFGLGPIKIEVGSKARITCFDPTMNWEYKKDDIKSTSFNSPFINQEFTGKVIATIC